MMKFPIKVEEWAADDLNIVDADGNVVVKLNWHGELNHIQKQREIGKKIVDALTLYENGVSLNGDNFCVGEKVEKETRKVRNPWGRSGRPK